MKLRQVILCGIVTALAVACCPCRHLTTSTQDSVRGETVVRTEYIPDTVFVKVPIESERQTVREILHENLPLWTSVRLDYPIEELQAIVLSEPELWTEEQIRCIYKVGEAAWKLIACAENMKKNIK